MRSRPAFRTTTEHDWTSKPFEPLSLPDHEKERLCRVLLDEFGAVSVNEFADGELRHGCLLPNTGHTDQLANPTASLNYKRLTYNCFGCGGSGGLLWFISTCRGIDHDAARIWLDEQTGLGADEQSLSSLLDFFDSLYSRERDKLPPIPTMSPRVLDPWRFIHPYMTEMRRIPEQTLIRFRVGWNPETDRIVIPHFWRGELVGWQSRRLSDDGTPKYLSTTDFPKDRTIYNHDEKASTAVVVESPASVLSKFHLLHHIESTFGARVTERQCRLLSIHRKVFLFFDNDEAGWTATQVVGDALEAYSDVWVASNPFVADPADLDDDTYEQCLREAIPYSLWTKPKNEDLREWRVDERIPELSPGA